MKVEMSAKKDRYMKKHFIQRNLFYAYCASAFTFLARRDFLRAAAFL